MLKKAKREIAEQCYRALALGGRECTGTVLVLSAFRLVVWAVDGRSFELLLSMD